MAFKINTTVNILALQNLPKRQRRTGQEQESQEEGGAVRGQEVGPGVWKGRTGERRGEGRRLWVEDGWEVKQWVQPRTVLS